MNTFKEILNEHIKYREQVLKMAKADLVKTYSGSALGWAWAVIRPVVTILIYWFIYLDFLNIFSLLIPCTITCKKEDM